MRVEFRDFWGGFEPRNNVFSNLFGQMGNIEVVDSGGDVCVFSCFGASHRTFRGCKVFVTGENRRPNFIDADFCIGFDHVVDDRYLRYPLWAWYGWTNQLLHPYDENITEEQTDFCAFVVSNPDNRIRNQIFKELSRHRHVHSAGRLFNNDSIGSDGPPGQQSSATVSYMRRFQFTIAAENSSFPGYTTEKLMQAFVAGSIPIYWGDPLVDYDFDPRSFVNFSDYGTVNGLVQAVLELAEDPVAMDRMRAIAPLSEQSWNRSGSRQLLEDFFERVFENAESPGYELPPERRRTLSRGSGLAPKARAQIEMTANKYRREMKLRLLR
jgi:hypothetical protein